MGDPKPRRQTKATVVIRSKSFIECLIKLVCDGFDPPQIEFACLCEHHAPGRALKQAKAEPRFGRRNHARPPMKDRCRAREQLVRSAMKAAQNLQEATALRQP